MGNRRLFTYLFAMALVLASLALTACGDSDDSSDDSGGASADTATTDTSSSGGGAALSIDAVENGPEQYAFSKSTLDASPGEVVIDMTNPQGNQAPHAVAIEGNGTSESGQVVSGGGTSTVTADLKPGKYTFYCPVDDHRDEGMEGNLTVR